MDEQGTRPDNAPRYRQLKAWQTSDHLAVEVYRLTKRLPRDEYWLKRSDNPRRRISAG